MLEPMKQMQVFIIVAITTGLSRIWKWIFSSAIDERKVKNYFCIERTCCVDAKILGEHDERQIGSNQIKSGFSQRIYLPTYASI